MPANRPSIGRFCAAAVVISFGAAVAFGQTPAPAPSPDKVEAFAEAARKGDAATVRKLLDEGVDVNTKYRYDATALSFACDRGHVEVVKLLLERGADVNARDTFYRTTPLNWASSPAMGRKPQHAEIVGLLLKRGATGKEGALVAAIGAGDAAMVKVILDSGPMPAEALANALDAATQGGKRDIVAVLEQAGAKPHVEFKLDEADLARYAGLYRGPNEAEVTVAAADGRIVATLAGQRFILLGIDRTRFRIAERPGAVIAFQLENGAVKTFTLGQGPGSQVFARVEGR